MWGDEVRTEVTGCTQPLPGEPHQSTHTALPHLTRKPKHPLNDKHERKREYHDQTGSCSGSDIEIGIDLLPEMDRQDLGALVGKEQRHRHVVERGHKRQRAGAAAVVGQAAAATTKFSQPRQSSNIVCGVWNGQRGLSLPSELDPELGLVKPNDFACSSGPIFQHNFELRRNAGRGLNLQARAGPGEIPNCARDGMLSEKTFPDFNKRLRAGGCRLSNERAN